MGIHSEQLPQVCSAMREKLSQLIPDAEIRYKAELVVEINRLKRECNAIILGHNYMEPALFHTVPDIVGDSLQLSRQAAKLDCARIIFCGVKFMAETAKILNPTRAVLVPSEKAGCSLAASITAQDVRNLRAMYPGAPVVTYVNTYADVKAESDICVTSGNAARVLRALSADTIIFLPDEYMARNLAAETGKHVVLAGEELTNSATPRIIAWRGRCEVHEKFTVDDIRNARAQFPGVAVVTHPEASPEVVQASDFSAGTSAMVEFVQKSNAPHFLILTECSMGDNIIAENPKKDILRLCSVRCPHMNQITLEDTLEALRQDRYVVEIPEHIQSRARRAVERMLEY